jgi:hypothetical protein
MIRKKQLLLTGLGIGLIIILASGCGVYSEGKEINKKLTFDGDSIQALDIRMAKGDIQLEESSDDQITLLFTGEAIKDPENVLNASVEGSILKVQVNSEATVGINLVKSDNKLKLQVPKKKFDQIKVTNSAGNTSLSSLEAKNLELSAKNGDVTINGYKGETYHVQNLLGGIHVTNLTGKGNIEQSHGEVNIDLADFKQDLEINSSLGAVNIKIPTDSIFRLESKTMQNRYDIKLPMIFSQKGSTHQSGVSQQADGNSPLLKVKASNGKFVLEGK